MLLKALAEFVDWSVEVESREASRGVTSIAQTVTRDECVQSYVEVGAPRWLTNLRGCASINTQV